MSWVVAGIDRAYIILNNRHLRSEERESEVIQTKAVIE